MARVTEVYLIDDLNGERDESVETVDFGIDGKNYEIDLTSKNAEALREALAEYVASARRVGATPTAKPAAKARPSSGGPSEAQLAREWAKDNGIKVSDRGRVPLQVMEAYRADQTSQPRKLQAVPSPVEEVDATEFVDAVANRIDARPAEDAEPADSDRKVVAWMQAKGFKVPASGKPNAPMKARYRKEHLGA